jgi:hypothetical protein
MARCRSTLEVTAVFFMVAGLAFQLFLVGRVVKSHRRHFTKIGNLYWSFRFFRGERENRVNSGDQERGSNDGEQLLHDCSIPFHCYRESRQVKTKTAY